MEGTDEFAVCGGAIQIIDPETGLIIDTELKDSDLYAAFGVAINDPDTATTANADVTELKLFDIFRDKTVYPKSVLSAGTQFTTGQMKVFRGGVDVSTGSAFPLSSSSPFAGHWAASYYHYDRADTYAPLLIVTKDYEGLKYDYGDFSRGFFEDFLKKDFSIGMPYRGQSAAFSDGENVTCTSYDGDSNRTGITVFAPSRFVNALEAANDTLTITNLAKIDMTEGSKTIVAGLLNKGLLLELQSKLLKLKQLTQQRNLQFLKTFNSIGTTRKLFRLIPPFQHQQHLLQKIHHLMHIQSQCLSVVL